MKTIYNDYSIYALLGVTNKPLECATILAAKLTKAHNQYYTAMQHLNGYWYATNRFSKVNWQGK